MIVIVYYLVNASDSVFPCECSVFTFKIIVIMYFLVNVSDIVLPSEGQLQCLYLVNDSDSVFPSV